MEVGKRKKKREKYIPRSKKMVMRDNEVGRGLFTERKRQKFKKKLQRNQKEKKMLKKKQREKRKIVI